MHLFRRLVLGRPINILIFINFLFFGLLFFLVGPFDTAIPVSGLLLTLLMTISYYLIIKLKLGDQYIFLIISILTSVGVAMLFRLEPAYGHRQITWVGIAAVVYFTAYYIFSRIKNWDKYLYLYIAASMLLFATTFIFGTTIKGATNWIRIGSFNFQPAEAIKLSFVFMLASYFKYPEKLKNTYVFLAIVYLHIILLTLQRDMGMAMLFFSVFISIYYMHQTELKLFLYNIAAAAAIGVFSYFTMNHIKVRLDTWLNPWADIAGRGYQITQSLFAIAAGGFFGTGLGMGNPEYIPEVHTDFIFSAICEELGIFGGIAAVLLYFILIYRGFKIALLVGEPFRKVVALGITLTYSYQTFIIIGGVIKLIPLTGVTLPFISYGGSSLISAFAAFGILQALSKTSLEGEEFLEIEQQ